MADAKAVFVRFLVGLLLGQLSVDGLQFFANVCCDVDHLARVQVEINGHLPRRIVEGINELGKIASEPSYDRRLCS
jgi:hypothetical protein